ncbi:MAG: hypothetical protein GY888_24275 [Planctomycetaceae bacterium]|nr:hypothetical protein [Planctomycetaceae bacterium]
MAFIDWVEDDEATGKTAEIYAAWRTRNPGRAAMPDILKCFSPRPDVLASVIRFSDELHFSSGHLDRRVKEMLATYVSGLNACRY